MAKSTTGTVEFDAGAPVDDAQPRSRWLGVFALGTAVTTALLLGFGIGTSMGGNFVTGTALGYSAAAASFCSVLLGLVAVIGRRGRVWGIAAMLLGFFANPFVLTAILGIAADWVVR